MKKLMLIVVVLLAGCSGWPANVAELTERGVSELFTVNQPYQQVYRNFKTVYDHCMKQPGLWQLGTTVDSDLYPDLGEGQFIIKLVTQFGQPKPFRMITINRINDKQSTITVVNTGPLDKNAITAYRRWANGDLTCE